MLKCALSVVVFCCAVSVPILAAMPKTSRSTRTRGSRQAPYQPTTQNRGRATQARSTTRRGRSTRSSAHGGGVRRSVASQPPVGSPPVAVPPIAHSEAADSENPRWWTWTSSSLLSGRRCDLLPATLPQTQRQVLHGCSITLFACGVRAWATAHLQRIYVYMSMYIWVYVYVCIYVCISKCMGMKKKKNFK